MQRVTGGCGGVPPGLGVSLSRVMVLLLSVGAALLQVPRVEGDTKKMQIPHCTRNDRKNPTIAINEFFTVKSNPNPYDHFSIAELDYSGFYDLSEINNVELFRGTSAWKLDQTCSSASLQEKSLPNDTFHLQNLCPLYTDIRVYAVKQNGRVLNGWLHIEVQMKDTTISGHYLEYVYVEVQDENFKAIGEIIVDQPWECQPSTDKIRSLSKYHNFPCFATAPREHQASTAIFITKKSYIDKKNDNEGKASDNSALTLSTDKEGLHFMWRLSEYWCNRHEKFRVMVIVHPHGAWCTVNTGYSCPPFTSIKHQKINQRKITDWFHPRWYGAADIRLEGHDKNGKKHNLDCKSLAAEYDKTNKEYKLTHDGATWIEKVEKYSLRSDYFNLLSSPVQNEKYYFSGSCQYTEIGKARAAFNGRCVKDRTSPVNADKSVAQFCDKNGNSSAFRNLNISIFKNYTEYKTNILSYRLTPPCVTTCNVPSTKEDAERIKKTYPELTKKENPKFEWSRITRLRAPKRATLIWTCRKIHGEICLFIVLFLMPVSIFLSRYYKETFMSVRWYGCFFVHCCTSSNRAYAIFPRRVLLIFFILSTVNANRNQLCRHNPPVEERGFYSPAPEKFFPHDPLPFNCENTRATDLCDLCCYPGYTPIRPVCTENENATVWVPPIGKCQPESTDNCKIGTFNDWEMVRIEDCQRRFIFGLYFSKLDRIPIISILHYEYKNLDSVYVDSGLGKTWRMYQCDLLRQHQLDSQFYVNHPNFDHGHCHPFKDTQYSYAAIYSSYSYINAVPQIVHLNRGSWRIIEQIGRRADLLENFDIFHIFGSSHVANSIPLYIFKIFCFSSNENTFVFGFIAENTEFRENAEERFERLQELFTPKSIDDIVFVTGYNIREMLTQSKGFFRDGQVRNSFKRCAEPRDFLDDETETFIQENGFDQANLYQLYNQIKSDDIQFDEHDYDQDFESDDGEYEDFLRNENDQSTLKRFLKSIEIMKATAKWNRRNLQKVKWAAKKYNYHSSHEVKKCQSKSSLKFFVKQLLN